MKVHYFQRYHAKENVATANTMLLLSRLYQYSSKKFFEFLKSEFFENSDFEPEIVFNLQERSIDSVPDATITQESFKVVVETKMSDWFYSEQLEKHLNSFDSEKFQVIITLAPELMSNDKKAEFEQNLTEYNSLNNKRILHLNTTFESIANAIQEVIGDRDDEMQEILDDYLQYCYHDKLISGVDSWKIMRVKLAGTTLKFNMSQDVYYDKAERGFRAHDYIGLYKNKCVCAIGKTCAQITAIEVDNQMRYEVEYGELTEERKQKIEDAIVNGEKYGYDLRNYKHRYFFVEKFYETEFKKTTPRAPLGARVFDLTEVLNSKTLPTTQDIAELLKTKTWQ